MNNLVSFPVSSVPSDAPLQDYQVREAALNTRISCIVEAPAGSGKTGLLMQRYLKLLAGESPTALTPEQPEEILAITFTKKAAAELRERVLHQLTAAFAQNPPASQLSPFDRATRDLAAAALARDSAAGWHILDRPQRLNIRTIDSVCAQIADSLPLLSGSASIGSPIADPEPLYRLAAQRTLLQLGGSDAPLDNALRNILLHRDGSLVDVESLLAAMLAQREQWGSLIPLSTGPALESELSEARQKLELTLEFIICSALTRTLSFFPVHLLEQTTTIAAHLGAQPQWKDKAPLAPCAGKHIPPTGEFVHLEHWIALAHLLVKKDGEWRKSIDRGSIGHNFDLARYKPQLLQLLADLQSSANAHNLLEALGALRLLPSARYPENQWSVLRSLFFVLRHALVELQLLFAERSQCDFAAVSLAARTALRSLNDEASAEPSNQIAIAFGTRLRHLLVDEMQDTSAAQYDLIHQLTRSWDGSSQTLFLVGDPKQSIYLFRQARVERFLRTMREGRLGDVALTPLYLTANFRSQAGLVHQFNSTFGRIFALPQSTSQWNSGDVPFVAATPTRRAANTLDIKWHTAVRREESLDFSSTGDPARDHELQQARDIRAVIQLWQAKELPKDRKHKPWRIAILARVRNHLAPIVAELKRCGIPYRAVDIDPLGQRPEVLDVLALTRALRHPADRPAWLAVLRAPWCGLSLADLIALTGDGVDLQSPAPKIPISTLVETRRHLLSSKGRELLDRAWPILSAALSSLGSLPLHVHIERTWRSLGGDAPLLQNERVNVHRYLTELRKLLAESPTLNLSLLNDRLDSLYAEPATGNISLELLTIHGAKGLEWDVVIVPGLERQAAPTRSDLLNWMEIDNVPTAASPVLIAPIWKKGDSADKLNKWLSSARDKRLDGERCRLFYVLATRAQEELHLFAAVDRSSSGSLAPAKHGSLLKSIWLAAEVPFRPLEQPPAQTTKIVTMAAPNSVAIADEPLDLAAAATESVPTVHRLPLSFNPLARFDIPLDDRLPYPAATTLPQAPAFDRPEGSFAVRAFGNVVHRFLQLIAARLETDLTPDILLSELPGWQPRLITVLRAEGLAPAAARRDAARALKALQQSLTDPEGRWLLSPHTNSTIEQSLISAGLQDLRADRTFFAGPTPLSEGTLTHWIVDFKTATDHSRTVEDFEAAELAKYRAQLETYARIRRGLLPAGTPIRLALYYPLIPRLIQWEHQNV